MQCIILNVLSWSVLSMHTSAVTLSSLSVSVDSVNIFSEQISDLSMALNSPPQQQKWSSRTMRRSGSREEHNRYFTEAMSWILQQRVNSRLCLRAYESVIRSCTVFFPRKSQVFHVKQHWWFLQEIISNII